MGTMRQKRRKKLARMWSEFQQQHELADEHVSLLRQTGYPLATLLEELSDDAFPGNTPMPERIQELHRQWQERLATRQAAVAAGLIEPKKKRKKPKDQHDPAWAKAKALCRLNMEDIRMAKKLGMSPRSLMKNVPSPTQPWKASVKFWIRDLYAKRQEKPVRRHPPNSAGSAPPPRSPAPNLPPGPQTPQPEQDPPSFSESEF